MKWYKENWYGVRWVGWKNYPTLWGRLKYRYKYCQKKSNKQNTEEK